VRLHPQVRKVVLVAALSSFLAQLDATVVNVSPQHGYQDKMRAHGTLGVEIERLNRREHTARLAAFLEKRALGRNLDGFAKLEQEASARA
jgi:hypothetical protein